MKVSSEHFQRIWCINVINLNVLKHADPPLQLFTITNENKNSAFVFRDNYCTKYILAYDFNSH